MTINLYVVEAFRSHYAYLLAFEVFTSNRLTMRFVYIVYIILKTLNNFVHEDCVTQMAWWSEWIMLISVMSVM